LVESLETQKPISTAAVTAEIGVTLAGAKLLAEGLLYAIPV